MEVKGDCLISIIIPCFNSSAFIRNTILSILNQNWSESNYEIIIIDDGSTDNSIEIIEGFGLIDNLFVYKNLRNKGVSFSRNLGISKARGHYLYFLDSDDEITANFFSTLYPIIQLGVYDLISFGFKIEKKEITINCTNNKIVSSTYANNEFLIQYFSRKILQCMCSFLCKRELIINNFIKFDLDTFFAEDQEFQILCMLNSDRIYYISEELFVYKFHDSNTMQSEFSERRLTQLNAFKRLSFIFNKNSKLNKYFNNYFLYNYFGLRRLMIQSNVDISTIKKDKNNYEWLKEVRPSFMFHKLALIVCTLFVVKKVLPGFFNSILIKKSK